jgi:hypothetical protein
MEIRAMQLRQIEIDFEIHKMIEQERRSFDEPPYVALRRLLKLQDQADKAASMRPPATASQVHLPATGSRPFVEDGVTIPHGSKARMVYARGSQVYEGEFLDGKLVVNGISYSALSPAASALGITKTGTTTSLNGWLYWQAKFPGTSKWLKLWDLRERARKR